MRRAEELFGRLLAGLALGGCAVLFLMMAVICLDVLLRAIPARLAWLCEWAVDALALGCCVVIAWYGIKAVLSSHAIGGMVVKVISVPEWWLLAPLPATFALLAIEVLFRMRRLYEGERAARTDAVTAA